MNEEHRGWLIAHAMHSELEEIEKVAFWGSLTKAIKATGKRWRDAGKGKTFVPRWQGGKKVGYRQTEKAGIGDYLKFHGGKVMRDNPGVVAGTGIGAGTLGAGKLVFGD